MHELEREREREWKCDEGDIVRESEVCGEGEGCGKWFTIMKGVNHFTSNLVYFSWSIENVFSLSKFLVAPNTRK